jgi:hypothetical protein
MHDIQGVSHIMEPVLKFFPTDSCIEYYASFFARRSLYYSFYLHYFVYKSDYFYFLVVHKEIYAKRANITIYLDVSHPSATVFTCRELTDEYHALSK